MLQAATKDDLSSGKQVPHPETEQMRHPGYRALLEPSSLFLQQQQQPYEALPGGPLTPSVEAFHVHPCQPLTSCHALGLAVPAQVEPQCRQAPASPSA